MNELDTSRTLANVLETLSSSQNKVTFAESKTKEHNLTYSSIIKKAKYVAFNLNEMGIKEGDELVFQYQSNANFVVTFWACIIGKIIPVPITYGKTDLILSKISSILEYLKNPHIITDDNTYKSAFSEWCISEGTEENPIILRIVNFDKVNYEKSQIEPKVIYPDDIAFIQFSSGSTGNPKGVVNTHKSILTNISDMTEEYKVSENDKTLCWMPLTHDMGLILFHILPFVNNIDQYLIPAVYFLTFPDVWFELASKYEITIMGASNFAFSHCIKRVDKNNLENVWLGNIRFIVNSAEQVSKNVCESFIKKFASFGLKKNAFRPSYGLAEATLGVSTCRENEKLKIHYINRNNLNIGDKIKYENEASENAVSFVDLGKNRSTKIVIKDNEGIDLPNETLGIVHIQGESVTKGYYNNPEETKKIINHEDFLNTGDVGFLCEKRLVITGRYKEVIILKGQNYYPSDFEEIVYNIMDGEINKCAVIGVPNDNSGTETIVCYLEFQKDKLNNCKEQIGNLKSEFQERIGIGLDEIISIDKMPLTTSGKIKKFELKKLYLNSNQNDNKDVILPLKNKQKVTEESMEEIKEFVLIVCRDLLNDSISTTDNFFEMGFTSNMAVQIKGKIESKYDVVVDDLLMFEYPNIDLLTKHLYEICN